MEANRLYAKPSMGVTGGIHNGQHGFPRLSVTDKSSAMPFKKQGLAFIVALSLSLMSTEPLITINGGSHLLHILRQSNRWVHFHLVRLYRLILVVQRHPKAGHVWTLEGFCLCHRLLDLDKWWRNLPLLHSCKIIAQPIIFEHFVYLMCESKIPLKKDVFSIFIEFTNVW